MKHYFFTIIAVFLTLTTACKKEETTPGTIRIGALGDSITRGVSEANYPDELKKLIPDNYEVSNYGVAATCLVQNCFNPIWDTDRFANLLTDQPDIITIMMGTNDGNPTNSDSIRANFEKDYRTMIDLFQTFPNDPRIVLCYPPPVYAQSMRIDSLIRTELIPIIDRIAEDYQLDVADTYYQVDDYPEHYPDNLHPDKGGVETLAKIIAEALKL